MVHVVPCKKTIDALQVASLFFREIYKLHGLSISIMSERDTRILEHFWRSLQRLLCTSLDMSSAYHPKIDAQTKITNRALGDLLRCLVGDNIRAWNAILSQAEYPLNYALNRSARFCSFCIAYDVVPRYLLDMSIYPDHTRLHGRACDLVKKFVELHQ